MITFGASWAPGKGSPKMANSFTENSINGDIAQQEICAIAKMTAI